MDAYLSGIEAAAQAGHDISTIHSVASFFVSRVDTEIDKRLDAIGTPEATALKGKAALANARLAYAAYQEIFEVESRFHGLVDKGAIPNGRCGPRPAPRTPTTPTRCTSASSSHQTPSTPCRARRWSLRRPRLGQHRLDHRYLGSLTGVFDKIAGLGVDLDDVFVVLEDEGVSKFEEAWNELLAATAEQLDAAKKA